MKIIDDAKAKLRTEILSIEVRKDLTDDEKVSHICTIFGTTCAAIAVQPIPFADVFILTPIQGLMGKKIADIRGYSITDAGMKEVLIEVASLIGLGAAGQQFALGLYKVGLPGLAGFTTIPLVFGITYGMGKAMDYYFKQKVKGEKIDKTLFKKIYNQEKEKGKQKSKEQKEEISEKKSWFKNGDDSMGDYSENVNKNSSIKKDLSDLAVEQITVDEDDVERFYRENGQIELEVVWEEGNVKRERSWHENGQLEREGIWEEGEVKEERTWYSNGQLESEDICEEGEVIVSRKWFTNGRKWSEWYYVNGESHGVQRQWFENGQLEAEYNTKEGLKIGAYRQWYQNGQLYRETNFNEDKVHGILKHWHQNGQLKLEVSYINGLQNGIFRRWRENGQISVDGFYVNDKKQGNFKQWDREGRLKREINYQNGEKI